MTDDNAFEIIEIITKQISECESPSDYTFLEKAAYVKGLEDACGAIGRSLASVVKISSSKTFHE